MASNRHKKKKIDYTHMELSSDEEIILVEKIKIALEQIKNGEFLTEEELAKEIEKWN